MTDEPFVNLEFLLSTLARLFAQKGDAKLVALLATSLATLEVSGYDNWDSTQTYYNLNLSIPIQLYAQVVDEIQTVEEKIRKQCEGTTKLFQDDHITGVKIAPSLSTDDDWRDKALAWLSGEKINNQGKVRSDNIASRNCDGLLFRSQAEINLYKALKSLGVSFAPLPVFVRGGKEYRRIEPDFVVVKDGLLMIVEVDGDTVHQETPAEAHARTTMLVHEGVALERVKASECDTEQLARNSAQKILEALKKQKRAR